MGLACEHRHEGFSEAIGQAVTAVEAWREERGRAGVYMPESSFYGGLWDKVLAAQPAARSDVGGISVPYCPELLGAR